MQCDRVFYFSSLCDRLELDEVKIQTECLGTAVMVRSDPWLHLPTGDELPGSDDTPLDNELQNEIPNLLKFIVSFIWANRYDWFFAKLLR